MAKRSFHPGPRTTLIPVLLACLLLAPAAPPAAQQRNLPAAAPIEPPPSAEHAVLHRLLGEWSASMEVSGANGEGTEKIRATEVVRSCCGGLFVIPELSGRTKRTPRGGRGILGYDPARGRYLLTWADTRSTSLASGEGDYDEAGDAITFVYERPDGRGGRQQLRDLFAWDGPDRRSRTISIIGDDGSERPWIVIQYRRK